MYLAELLLSKWYEVHGLIRRSSTFITNRIDYLYRDFHDPESRIFLHHGDPICIGSASPPQNELTPFKSESPYASDMVYAYYMVKNYRKAYNIFGCNGILFNHESPRRGETFITRKITRAATRIKFALQKKLYLGNQH